jgi:hypothetical protein
MHAAIFTTDLFFIKHIKVRFELHVKSRLHWTDTKIKFAQQQTPDATL